MLAHFTGKIVQGLINSGVGPLLFAGIIAPAVFEFLFGYEWRRAGELVSWMTPWFVMQFLSSPISMVMHVTSRQKSMFYIMIIGLIIRLGGTFLLGHFYPTYIGEIYSLTGLLFYVFCIHFYLRAAGLTWSELLRMSYKAKWVLLGWASLGGLTVAVLHFLRN